MRTGRLDDSGEAAVSTAALVCPAIPALGACSAKGGLVVTEVPPFCESGDEVAGKW